MMQNAIAHVRSWLRFVVALLAATLCISCVRNRATTDRGASLPVRNADSTLVVSAEADGLHLTNRSGTRVLYTAYERLTLLERNADRDSCMLNPVAQCPSIAPHATIILRYDAAVHNPARESGEFTIRYWRATDSSYPRGVSHLTVRRP
jgi:hypothetical protein